MTQPAELVLVAALEREVSKVVKSWTPERVGNLGGYRSGNAVLFCCGTGVKRAFDCTKVLIEAYSPEVVTSIGFTGSCNLDLAVGSISVPATVVDAETGSTYSCAFGNGVLVTGSRVAGAACKREFARKFSASIVDMEAAGVASAAQQSGIDFAAVKAVSDGFDEDLEFLSPFVRPDGFDTARFLLHVVTRPRLWPVVGALQRGSDLASRALQESVEELMSDRRAFAQKHSAHARVS